MVAGTFLLALLLYVDRVCISVAKEPISAMLDLSDKQMGWVLAAFSLGLMLFITTLILNVIALHVVRKYREQYE